MSKKIIVGFVSVMLIAGLFGFGAANYASAQNVTLTQLVELLISLGVIAPDKVAAARSFVNSNQNIQATTTANSANTTTTNAISTCPTNAVSQRGLNNKSFTCSCLSAGTNGIWGTDTYTDDSPICTAAKHAGLTIPGNVTYTIKPGQSLYPASTRNNVTGSGYGGPGYAPWQGSYSFTITAPQTTVTGTQTINPNSQTVASGQAAHLNFTYPSNTVKATLYVSCPSGVGIGGAKGNITDCNTYADVTNSLGADFQLINNTSSPINVVPSYYIYTSDNPNYAKGVSASITVQAGQTVAINNHPTVSISGSSNLTVGQTGSWSFGAADGDGNLAHWQFCASTNSGCRWTPTSGSFPSGTYSVNGTYSTSFPSAGSYTWIVNANDSSGASGNASITVNVTDPTSMNAGSSNLGSMFISIDDVMRLFNALR